MNFFRTTDTTDTTIWKPGFIRWILVVHPMETLSNKKLAPERQFMVLTMNKILFQMKIKHKRIRLRSAKMNQFRQVIPCNLSTILADTCAVRLHCLVHFGEILMSISA